MKYLPTKEAAHRLGYKGDVQIHKLIQRGQLNPERLGNAWAISEDVYFRRETRSGMETSSP